MFKRLIEIRQRMERVNYLSWEYLEAPSRKRRIYQVLLQSALRKTANASFEDDCFVSPAAKIYTHSLIMKRGSYISGGSIVRHDLIIGKGSCIGTYCHIAGKVHVGADTMIANSVSIFGFNHGMALDSPMMSQPCSTRGIVIGDNCWIGANATIVDGVSIGSHSIVAAGTVVTKSFPEWSIIGGVPARHIRDRREPMRDKSVATTQTRSP